MVAGDRAGLYGHAAQLAHRMVLKGVHFVENCMGNRLASERCGCEISPLCSFFMSAMV